MNDMNPYPTAAEAVDGQLAKSIDTLTVATRDGFKRVEDQMREMATKDAVNAQVQRLDLRVDHTESKMETGFRAIEAKVAEGFALVASRDSQRDAAAKERDDERDRKFSRRTTWLLTGLGLVITVVQYILLHFTK